MLIIAVRWYASSASKAATVQSCESCPSLIFSCFVIELMESGGLRIMPISACSNNDGKLVGAYTTSRHLLLDLDHCGSRIACKIAEMVIDEYRDVGECLVMESSKNKCHHVYGAYLSWGRLVHITETLAALGFLNRDYQRIRRFRHDLSLRITEVDRGKGTIQPRPHIIAWVLNPQYPKREGILEYLGVMGANPLSRR